MAQKKKASAPKKTKKSEPKPMFSREEEVFTLTMVLFKEMVVAQICDAGTEAALEEVSLANFANDARRAAEIGYEAATRK